MGCIDPRCDQYKELFDEFNCLGSCFGPENVNGGELSSEDLRAWWDSHGCVRCWIEACDKKMKGNWEPICKDIGNDEYVMGNPQIVQEMQTAINRWKDRSNRVRGRFYCVSHVKALKCGCTLFGKSRSYVGHVGWVYAIPKPWRTEFYTREWMIGEETATNGDEGPFDDLESTLLMQGYHKWKPLWSRDGNFEEAYLMSMELRAKGYSLTDNNCNIAAHAVLTSFGADLIPSRDDAYFGLYPPGDYFNFIRVPAVDLDQQEPTNDRIKSSPARWRAARKAQRPEVPVLRQREAAPLRTGACAEMSAPTEVGARRRPTRTAGRHMLPQELPLIEAVYIVESALAVHLTLACQALRAAASEPEEHGIVETDDLDDIAEKFGAPVCGTCLRLLAASTRIVWVVETKGGTLEFCHSRLRLLKVDREVDIMFERISGFRRKVVTFTPTAVVWYRIPLPGGIVATKRLDLPFHTVADRDQCLIELDKALRQHGAAA